MKPLSEKRKRELAEAVGNPTRNADYPILVAMLEHGKRLPDGKIQITTELLAEKSLCQVPTVYKRIRLMQTAGLIRRISDNRKRKGIKGSERQGAIFEVLV